MLVGYSKIGYQYLFFLPPACIRGPGFICPYRPRPRLLSEARPLIESRSLFEDLRYMFSLILSHINYCLPTWSTANSTTLKPVMSLYKQAINRLLSWEN